MPLRPIAEAKIVANHFRSLHALVHVVHVGLGVFLRQGRPAVAVADQFARLAVRVVPVAENAGLGRATDDTGRLQTKVNAAAAKITFADGPRLPTFVAVRLESLPFPLAKIVIVEDRLGKLGAVVVGTCDGAGVAADAFVLIDHDNPVFPRKGRAAGTGLFARRLVTLIAQGGNMDAPDIGKGANLDHEGAGEEDVLGQGILHLAGDNTGVAADAALQIKYHAPFRHMWSSLTGGLVNLHFSHRLHRSPQHAGMR